MGRKSLHLLSVLLVLAVGSVGVHAAPFQQDAGPDGLVSIEAEHYDKNTPQGGHTWELVGPTGGFTGEAGMQALPDSGANTNDNYLTDAPRLDYEINFVKTGTYYVWVRGWGVDGGADSIHSGLDNQAIATADRITGFMTNYRWTNAAYEDPERIMFDITTPGKHTLNIWMREDGAIVDKIVLTTNPDYQPTGEGPPESKRGLPVLATNPSPAAGATDVPHDTLLAWNASAFAQTHDVYFGTVFADVNAAGRTDQKGVLANQGRADAVFDPPDLLDFGTTYYWRVDEINAPPDNTIFKGDVWSFTVEPYGYAIQPIAATASSAQDNMGPEKTIDGSGLTGDLHGIEPTTMWLSGCAAQLDPVRVRPRLPVARVAGVELQPVARELPRLRRQGGDDRDLDRWHDLDAGGQPAGVCQGARRAGLCGQHDGRSRWDGSEIRQADHQQQLGRHGPADWSV
jgi:hypothetical protein